MALTSWGKSPIDVDHISSCFDRKKFLQETHNFSTCSMMTLQKDGEIRVSYLSFEIRSLIVVVGTMELGSILLPIRVLLRLRGELILCVQDIGSYLRQVVLEILQHLQVPPHPGVVCTPPLIPPTGLPRCTQTQSDYYHYYYYSGAPEIKNRVTSICNIPLPTMTQKQNLENQNRSTTRLRNKTKPKDYWVHGKRGNKCRSMDIPLSDQIMLRMGRERVHHHHNMGLKEAFNYLQATHTHTHTQSSLALSLSLSLSSCPHCTVPMANT